MSRWSGFLTILLWASGCGHSPDADDAQVVDDAGAPDASLALPDASVVDLSPSIDLAAAVCAADGATARSDGGTPTFDDLARLCALAASCGGDLNASGCVNDLIGGWPQDPVAARFVSCIGASDCPSLYGCFGGTLLNTNHYNPSGHCDGTTVVDAKGNRFDCCGLGLTCVSEAQAPVAYCGVACPFSMFGVGTCAGDVALYCIDGVVLPTDCRARYGAQCQNGRCVGNGGPCAQGDQMPCNGSVETICVGGHWQSHDCNDGSLNNTCVDHLCLPPQPNQAECMAGDVRCAGDQLRVCTNGLFIDVDCHALGFQTCGPAFGTAGAICK